MRAGGKSKASGHRATRFRFTEEELVAMHEFCCAYRDAVRSGAVPSTDRSAAFLRYQRVLYALGEPRETA